MSAPGALEEWNGSAAAWEARVTETLGALDLPEQLKQATKGNATELRIPDWPAVPARARARFGRREADRMCDERAADGDDVGRTSLQDEYAEWRVVRDECGRAVRFELTTELADYWELLARYAPARAIDVVGEFAGVPVGRSAVFGAHNPFGATSTEDSRANAFCAEMLGRDRDGNGLGRRPGQYNNGAKAITCLARKDNSLAALAKLVAAAAAAPQLVVDPESGEARFPSGSEAIPTLWEESAKDGRNSDPVVVERIVRLATEGRTIRFDDPAGVHIVDVQLDELTDPGGAPLPREWCKLGRHGPPLPDGLARAQRLELEVPADAGFRLGEVRSRRTGTAIVHGAQIAELVQLAVYVRCGPRDAIAVDVPLRRLAA